jgi:hypothetical protein
LTAERRATEGDAVVRGIAMLLAVLVIGLPSLARADLARCKQVRREAARAGITQPRKPRALVRRLNSRRALRADLAYCRLVKRGPRAVDALLANTAAAAPYAGSAWVNPASSIVIAPPSQGLVSLYLVEAILAGAAGEGSLAPRLVPRLTQAGSKDQDALLASAATLYRTWWAAHRTTPLDELRAAGAHPLRDTPLDWL